MSRYQTPEHIKKMRKEGLKSQSSALAPETKPSRYRWKALEWIGGFAIIFGLIQGVMFFFTDVSVTPEAPLNPDPLSSPFIVQNMGNFAIYDVDSVCALSKMATPAYASISNFVFKGSSTVPVMESKETAHVRCRETPIFASGPPPANASVTINVVYRPIKYMWHKKVTRKFKTVMQSDGQLRWEPLAKSDPEY